MEGIWTAVHFSYSIQEGRAVGYIKFNDDWNRVEIEAVHRPLKLFFHFLFGGRFLDLDGIQGQFANMIFGLGETRFIDTAEEVADFLSAMPHTLWAEGDADDIVDEPTEATAIDAR